MKSAPLFRENKTNYLLDVSKVTDRVTVSRSFPNRDPLGILFKVTKYPFEVSAGLPSIM